MRYGRHLLKCIDIPVYQQIFILDQCFLIHSCISLVLSDPRIQVRFFLFRQFVPEAFEYVFFCNFHRILFRMFIYNAIQKEKCSRKIQFFLLFFKKAQQRMSEFSRHYQELSLLTPLMQESAMSRLYGMAHDFLYHLIQFRSRQYR